MRTVSHSQSPTNCPKRFIRAARSGAGPDAAKPLILSASLVAIPRATVSRIDLCISLLIMAAGACSIYLRRSVTGPRPSAHRSCMGAPFETACGMIRVRPRLWLLVWTVWAVVVVIVATQNHLYRDALGDHPSWLDSFRYPVVECTFWAALTPLLVAMASRFNLLGRRRLRNVAVWLPANA